MPIKVSRKVFDAIEEIRQSGLTNMLDRTYVQRLCYEKEYYEAVEWLEDNKEQYAEAIFSGFEIIEHA